MLIFIITLVLFREKKQLGLQEDIYEHFKLLINLILKCDNIGAF